MHSWFYFELLLYYILHSYFTCVLLEIVASAAAAMFQLYQATR